MRPERVNKWPKSMKMYDDDDDDDDDDEQILCIFEYSLILCLLTFSTTLRVLCENISAIYPSTY